jgi:hypothetical protein
MAPAKGHILLVGSLGMDDADTAFRELAARLGPRAKRYPDGEPGERSYWIRWQNTTFSDHPAFVLQEARNIEGYKDDKKRPLYVLADGIDPESLDIGPLGYADAALESWDVFSRLIEEGIIPTGTRFQVCMPSCGALLTSFIHPDSAPVVEPALEQSMRNEAVRLAEQIPAEALAIQWDVAYEVIAADGGQPSLHYDDAVGGSIDRIARHIDWVPDGVEAGVHLCYGDPGHQHVIEPTSLATCVTFANGICTAAGRNVDWIHLPVPRDRDDDAYAAPLADLRLNDETELYIGCVHHTDGVEGTIRRLDAAEKFVQGFGIATECGFGRRDPATVTELLDIHASIVGS